MTSPCPGNSISGSVTSGGVRLNPRTYQWGLLLRGWLFYLFPGVISLTQFIGNLLFCSSFWPCAWLEEGDRGLLSEPGPFEGPAGCGDMQFVGPYQLRLFESSSVIKKGIYVAMKLLAKITAAFDRTLELLVVVACAIVIFTLLSVVADVLLRYFFNSPLIWELEINETLILFLVFLPAAWLLKRDRHVKMDLVIRRLKPRPQALLYIFTASIGVIVCWVLFWYGVQVTWDHFQRGTYQLTVLQIPNAAVLWVIPFSSFLMFIQLLRKIYGYWGSWKASSE